ncbi:MAG: Asp-tRNA(Asn)/Glu-tRNA(Gln) amidotransferase subunit GatC [Bacilli bacterium]|nr:Asp-tRNA(Asn)/Glu-tRNA(Gln) amidotransferase subunit GatC [Bacilli bacterium]
MIEKEKLKKYARLLMFDMDEEEYTTLQEEFDTLLKQMDIIGQIEGIDKVEPMTFPFKNTDVTLREDEVGDYLTVGEVLANAKHQVSDQVKVPRVVEEGEE